MKIRYLLEQKYLNKFLLVSLRDSFLELREIAFLKNIFGKTSSSNKILNQTIFVLFCSSIVCCFEKQDHNITEPPIPVYTLHGMVQDMNTQEFLAGIEVSIYNKSTARDYEISAIDTTDNLGSYRFDEIISPGWCIITARRNGYAVFSQTLNTEYSDREYDMEIPKVLLSSDMIEAPYGNLQGLCWRDSNTLSVIDLWVTIIDGSEKTFYKIYERNMAGEYYRLLSASTESLLLKGLAFALANYMSISGNDIYQLSANNMDVQAQYTMEDFVGKDLTYDGSYLYLTATSKIVKILNLFSMEKEFYPITVQTPGGIAWDGNYFWITDINQHIIHQLDEHWTILQSFKLFEPSDHEQPIEDLKYISFDYQKKLWIAQEAEIYCFDIE